MRLLSKYCTRRWPRAVGRVQVGLAHHGGRRGAPEPGARGLVRGHRQIGAIPDALEGGVGERSRLGGRGERRRRRRGPEGAAAPSPGRVARATPAMRRRVRRVFKESSSERCANGLAPGSHQAGGPTGRLPDYSRRWKPCPRGRSCCSNAPVGGWLRPTCSAAPGAAVASARRYKRRQFVSAMRPTRRRTARVMTRPRAGDSSSPARGQCV